MADAGRVAPDGRAPRRLAGDVLPRPVCRRGRGGHLVPGEAARAVPGSCERRSAGRLPGLRGAALQLMATHYFPDDRVHYTWDAGREPVIAVDDGDTVIVQTRDVSDNQIGPDSDVSVLAGMDDSRLYPLAGRIRANGAAPGDTLAVEILDLHTQGWGWTAILPGLGLLSDDFTEPYLRIFDLSGGDFA